MDHTHKNKYTDFRPGVYLHYKKHLYEADHLVHNASEDNRIEVHYIGLELDNAKDGPRHATREFSEFFTDAVHEDRSKCEHGDGEAGYCKAQKKIAKRFCYLGPIFEGWMLDADPWSQIKQ